jgi:hypothetical protein
MGSPDPRQIDGVGGAHPLTSKVAVISPSTRDRCGRRLPVPAGDGRPGRGQRRAELRNILAGVGPFAIERASCRRGDVTPMCASTWSTPRSVRSPVPTPGGRVEYEGDARIDGVPALQHRSARLSRRRGFVVRGPVPDRARRGSGRRARGDVHRQRHARRLLRPPTSGCRQRVAGADRGNGPQGADREDPARTRAADEPRRRWRRRRCRRCRWSRLPARRRAQHPHVHPASRARGDRRARRRQRRDRVRAARFGGRAGRRLRSAAGGAARSTSSTRPASSRSRWKSRARTTRPDSTSSGQRCCARRGCSCVVRSWCRRHLHDRATHGLSARSR